MKTILSLPSFALGLLAGAVTLALAQKGSPVPAASPAVAQAPLTKNDIRDAILETMAWEWEYAETGNLTPPQTSGNPKRWQLVAVIPPAFGSPGTRSARAFYWKRRMP